MTAKRNVLCLFDIDGTLTPSRLVSNEFYVELLLNPCAIPSKGIERQ